MILEKRLLVLLLMLSPVLLVAGEDGDNEDVDVMLCGGDLHRRDTCIGE